MDDTTLTKIAQGSSIFYPKAKYCSHGTYKSGIVICYDYRLINQSLVKTIDNNLKLYILKQAYAKMRAEKITLEINKLLHNFWTITAHPLFYGKGFFNYPYLSDPLYIILRSFYR